MHLLENETISVLLSDVVFFPFDELLPAALKSELSL